MHVNKDWGVVKKSQINQSQVNFKNQEISNKLKKSQILYNIYTSMIYNFVSLILDKWG